MLWKKQPSTHQGAHKTTRFYFWSHPKLIAILYDTSTALMQNIESYF